MWQWFHRLASPREFYSLTQKWLPWLSVLACLLLVTGVVWGLAFAPADYKQGNSFRIFYIHVPSAVLAQACYVSMAILSAVALIWRIKLAAMMAKSAAPLGAWLTFLALVTGSIWGKPTWGTWWFWDARLTSMLILLFLYLGVIALYNAIQNQTQAEKSAAILTFVGLINIPIIKFSVEWWNTLHQKATFKLTGEFTISQDMLTPFWVMLAGFVCFFILALLLRTRLEILQREQKTSWVQGVLK